MEEDEKAIQEHLVQNDNAYYEFATPRKGIFLNQRKGVWAMIKLEGKLINVFTQEGGTNKKASRSTSVTNSGYGCGWTSQWGR